MRRTRWWVAGLVLTLVVQPAIGGPVSADPGGSVMAPLHMATVSGLPEQYIVALKSTVDQTHRTAVARAKAKGATVGFEYRHAISGYSARLNAEQLAAVRADPDVAYVEQETIVKATDLQLGATWGLDRVDQRRQNLDHGYTFFATGRGVTAYVMDSGIRADHPEFGGRVAAGFTTVNDGRGTDDCYGHGTHVAGTIGSTTYGIAKQVTLVPVRVLDCLGNGVSGQALAGVEWVMANLHRPAVVNMSLVYNDSNGPSLEQAIRNSIAQGLTYVISAANFNRNACEYTPVRVAEAITVGATNSADSRDTRYSNYGPCLDLFAPGTAIESVSIRSLTEPTVADGTSMAAAHVTGAAALYLQHHPTAAPTTVRSAVVDTATQGIVAQAGPNSPNKLLYVPGPANRAFGYLDAVHLAPGGVYAHGWAIDPDVVGPIQVHLYIDDVYAGATVAANSRPDVGDAFPAYGPDHGFALTMSVPDDGTHTVCAYAINVEADDINPQLACRQIEVRHTPFGSFDSVAVGDPAQLTIEGWAIDLDTSGPVEVEVWVDWVSASTVMASFDRPDVGSAYPQFGPSHGFGTTIRLAAPLTHGDHYICISARNVGSGTNDLIGCHQITYAGDPFGAVEYAVRNAGAGTIRVSGWAIDPDTTAPTHVNIYVAGTFLGTFPADIDRPDIAAAHPGYGSAHGFSATIPLQGGLLIRQACAEAVNIGAGSGTATSIGCRIVFPRP